MHRRERVKAEILAHSSLYKLADNCVYRIYLN